MFFFFIFLEFNYQVVTAYFFFKVIYLELKSVHPLTSRRDNEKIVELLAQYEIISVRGARKKREWRKIKS